MGGLGGRGIDSLLTPGSMVGSVARYSAGGEAGPAGLHRQRQDTQES